jgi:hypothetical protein
MARALRLIPDEISHDTLEALRALTDDAKKGVLIGLAFAARYKGREYIVNAAGDLYQNPTIALGMVAMLADQLRMLERGG